MGFRYATGRLYKPKAVEAGDWWLSGGIDAANCLIAYQPKGAASYAASKVNLAKSGTYDATKIIDDPDWDITNGWKFSASNDDYLDCGLTPPSDTSWSAFVRFSDNTPIAAAALFGARTGNDYFQIYPSNYLHVRAYQHGNNDYFFGASASTSGVLGFAGKSAYLNGSLEGTIIGDTNLNISSNITVGALNYGGTYYDVTAYIQAFAIYNTTITSDQASALATAMNAL